MDRIRKGDWVRIHSIVLAPDQRAPKLPVETRQVPLEMWVTGTLMEDTAALGDTVRVRTATGRLVQGSLETVHPSYGHSFGAFVPELQAIRRELRDLMVEGGQHGHEPKL
jgi:hypothetical protein